MSTPENTLQLDARRKIEKWQDPVIDPKFISSAHKSMIKNSAQEFSQHRFRDETIGVEVIENTMMRLTEEFRPLPPEDYVKKTFFDKKFWTFYSVLWLVLMAFGSIISVKFNLNSYGPQNNTANFFAFIVPILILFFTPLYRGYQFWSFWAHQGEEHRATLARYENRIPQYMDYACAIAWQGTENFLEKAQADNSLNNDVLMQPVLEDVPVRRYSAPEPQKYGFSVEGAEHIVVDWMKHLGESDAKVTDINYERIAEVQSERYAAKVKHSRVKVSVGEVREIFAVASVEGRKPLFFTTGTYSHSAMEFAERANMPLFTFDEMTGILDDANFFATQCLNHGL